MADLDFLIIDAVLLFLAAGTAVAAIELRNLASAVMMLAIYSLLLSIVWLNMDAADVAFTEAAVGAGISTLLLLGTLVLTGRHEKPAPRSLHRPAFVAVAATGAMLVYGTLDLPAFGDPDAPAHTSPITHAFLDQSLVKKPRGDSPIVDGAHGEPEHGEPEHREPEHREPEHREPEHRASLHGDGKPDGAEARESGIRTTGDHDYFHGHVPNLVTSVIVSYRAYDTMFEAAVILTAGLGMILLLRGQRHMPDDDEESGGLL